MHECTIIVPASEQWDEGREIFINCKETKLILMHSLLSISKWESIWKESYLSIKEFTEEKWLDYVRCMTINRVDPNVYFCLTPENRAEIENYINDPMTATTFTDREPYRKSNDIITSEEIYWLMTIHNIPFSCEKWHLNRLMTLIRIAGIRNSSNTKKMPKKDILRDNHARNEARKARLKTRG